VQEPEPFIHQRALGGSLSGALVAFEDTIFVHKRTYSHLRKLSLCIARMMRRPTPLLPHVLSLMPQLDELTLTVPHCIPLHFDVDGPVRFPPLRKLRLIGALEDGIIETLVGACRRYRVTTRAGKKLKNC